MEGVNSKIPITAGKSGEGRLHLNSSELGFPAKISASSLAKVSNLNWTLTFQSCLRGTEKHSEDMSYLVFCSVFFRCHPVSTSSVVLPLPALLLPLGGVASVPNSSTPRSWMVTLHLDMDDGCSTV